ncbi:MAG: hypothetical protein JWO19_5224 [Bryobacterales bacterium]|jgi:hypothetical protein|nr:hypothetical protein [Bryobacterales bacterium]
MPADGRHWPYSHICMKTTVDLPDSLFREAKACAESRGVSFRQMIEEGLRAVIREAPPAATKTPGVHQAAQPFVKPSIKAAANDRS